MGSEEYCDGLEKSTPESEVLSNVNLIVDMIAHLKDGQYLDFEAKVGKKEIPYDANKVSKQPIQTEASTKPIWSDAETENLFEAMKETGSPAKNAFMSLAQVALT